MARTLLALIEIIYLCDTCENSEVEFGQTIENVEKRMVVTYHHYYMQGWSVHDVMNSSSLDL